MNNDNHLIFEGYRQKRYLTPKESLQRDKEFFNYVIESNSHLSSLKKFSTKKLFSSYVSTLANRIDSDNPGLIKESNMSDAEAFGILNEATQTVSDQEAYDAVKDIFEEIAVKQLINKADLFLEMMANPAQGATQSNTAAGPEVLITTNKGEKIGGNIVGPAKGQEGYSIVKTKYGQSVYRNDQIQQMGPDKAQQRKLAQRSGTAQTMRDLRAANQEGAARIAELEAKIQEMEAAEANMNQQQKAQSDSIQDQLAAMIKQIQNTTTNTVSPVFNIGGNTGASQTAPAATPSGQSTPATPKKPGVLSKIGAGIKKALPMLGTIGGAALGSTLGPAGTALGGALGRGLGRFFSPTDPKASFGQRLKDAGKSALAGGVMGLGGQIGAEMLGSSNPGQAGIDAVADYIQPDVNDDGIPIGSLGGPNPDGTTFDPDTGASTSYPAGYEANLRQPEDVEPYEPKVYPKGQNISEPPTGRIPKGTTPTR